MSTLRFTPSKKNIESSNLYDYLQWINHAKRLNLKDYSDLWRWSVDNLEAFWESLLDYFKVEYSGDYSRVIKGNNMPGVQWFEGMKLNYAQHIFRNKNKEHPALIFQSELGTKVEWSWKEFEENSAWLQNQLKKSGIKKGDAVVAYLPTIPHANAAFAAASASGMVWSSCSPDFGAESVIDRFQQIKPKAIVFCSSYSYGGKNFDKSEDIQKIINSLAELELVVEVAHPNNPEQLSRVNHKNKIEWSMAIDQTLEFESLDFSHPLWVLYSSGTTGKPKAITQSVGGCLLEHLKYMYFHNDLKKGEKFFWYTTTGWMMWNYLNGALLSGGTVVLYDGAAMYPKYSSLFDLADELNLEHFGTSAPYIMACKKRMVEPPALPHLRSISSTGAPLPPEGFEWVYDKFKNVYLWSMSGGTDVCTAFVGGNPMLPIKDGEIQCRALGVSLYALDENGNKLTGELGEMVIDKPMPSMPIYFWGDKNMERYKSSYFEEYPGKWRHGDYISIDAEGSVIIYGRSDATLNRNGIRIGTAEIYKVIDRVEEVEDSLIVNLEKKDGSHFMPLFVNCSNCSEELKSKIKLTLREQCSPRHVPDEIIQVPDIPYTISGKKMEAPVKRILMGFDVSKSLNPGAMRNPESLEFFKNFEI